MRKTNELEHIHWKQQTHQQQQQQQLQPKKEQTKWHSPFGNVIQNFDIEQSFRFKEIIQSVNSL